MGAGAPPRRRLQGGGCRPSVRRSSGAAACALRPHRTGCWGPTRCHRLTGAAGAHTEQLLSGSSVCSILPKIATFERNGQPACHLSACHLSGGSAGMRPLPSKPCPHAQLLGASPQGLRSAWGPVPPAGPGPRREGWHLPPPPGHPARPGRNRGCESPPRSSGQQGGWGGWRDAVGLPRLPTSRPLLGASGQRRGGWGGGGGARCGAGAQSSSLLPAGL